MNLVRGAVQPNNRHLSESIDAIFYSDAQPTEAFGTPSAQWRQRDNRRSPGTAYSFIGVREA